MVECCEVNIYIHGNCRPADQKYGFWDLSVFSCWSKARAVIIMFHCSKLSNSWAQYTPTLHNNYMVSIVIKHYGNNCSSVEMAKRNCEFLFQVGSNRKICVAPVILKFCEITVFFSLFNQLEWATKKEGCHFPLVLLFLILVLWSTALQRPL